MKKGRRGLRRKLIGTVCILITLMCILLIGISYRVFRDTYISFCYDKALGIVEMLAGQIDGGSVSGYVETGETDEQYDALLRQFNNIKAHTTDLSYLYLMVPYGDHFVYVIDAYTEEDDMDNISKLGDVFWYGETEYRELLPDVEAKRASTHIVYGADAGFGRTISVWAPVFDKDGNVAAMVEADYVLTEVEKRINSYVLRIVLFFAAAIIAITAVLIRVIDRGVVSPILNLTKYIDSYERGKTAKPPVRLREDNEIKQLSESFTEMVEKTDKYILYIKKITAEQERISAELNVATQIQADMLPRIFPAFPERKEFDIYASMKPAKEVGGDFYDFFLVDEGHLAMVMADVSGKGVPAALFMVIAKTLLKNRAQAGGTPAEILADVNRQLCEGNEAELFVTVWLAVLEISTGEGTAANAGHEHPVLRRAGGEYELVKYRHSPAVAAMDGISFREHAFRLNPGDSLFVYTDGVPEANNKENELFGTERMLEALNRMPDAGVRKVLENVTAGIDAFTAGAEQFDDMTLLCLKYVGCGKE